MAKFLSSILFGIVWIFSLLPLPVLYLFSDIIWLLMYIFPPLRYRKSIVRNNLSLSFPDKSKRWLRRTERRFYYQFACQFVEALKTVSAGKRWILRHMEFTGMDKLVQETINGRSGIGYLGYLTTARVYVKIPLWKTPVSSVSTSFVPETGLFIRSI